MRVLSFVFLIVMCGLSVGCKSAEQKQLEADLEVPSPLNLDPTDEFQLNGWWSNGEQLLHLRDDASYVMFDDLNRYSRPIERGRWAQISYAVMRLEPYSVKGTQATRVSIDRIDGQIALRVRNLKIFKGVDVPPTRAEDALIGQWSGSGGVLALRGDRRYSYSPPAATSPAKPLARAGHQGLWSLAGTVIRLQPDTPSIKPMSISIQSSGAATILRTEFGEMTSPSVKDAASTQPM